VSLPRFSAPVFGTRSLTVRPKSGMNRVRHFPDVLAAVALLCCCNDASAAIDNASLADEEDGRNWASYGRTFSENHYSPLREINSSNISHLGLAWFHDLLPVANTFAAPLEVNGTLYFAVGYSIVYALEARTGKLIWTYDPKVTQVAGHEMRAGWGIRGIAFWDGAVYTGTHDGRLIAIDAKTGSLLWSVQTTERNDGRYVTGPVWAFNGKIVIGHGGSDFEPVRGYVTAYDAKTGKQVWRFYTVPGDPQKPYESDVLRMAGKTWRAGDAWKFGGAGGTVWHAFAYDPKFNRLYFGTSNGLPWNTRIRGGGDNLFLASIVAVDADTGKYVWHYQVVPSDIWDYDATSDLEMATLNIGGTPRSVLMQAGKDGFFYVIDRKTGKLLSANNFSKVNWADHIDLKTGRPVERPDARFADGVPEVIFPGPVGAHATQAMSFNPVTGLAYIPTTELGFIYANPEGDLGKWHPTPGMVINNGIGRVKDPPPVPPGKSSLVAWDPVKQRPAWSVELTGIVNGSTLTTAGNLVIQGQVTGELSVYAAVSGRKIWSFDAQTGIVAQPISYTLDGKQYITIIAGWRGMGNATGIATEWEYSLQRRRVLTFCLDGNTKLPPVTERSTAFVDDPNFIVDPAKAAVGRAVAGAHCTGCHGGGFKSGGTAPDLRKSTVPLSSAAITAVLREGVLVAHGMPRFEEFTPAQIEGLQHYIREQERLAATQKVGK
jgi:quinohemoprotein ethanol dehydrogenase